MTHASKLPQLLAELDTAIASGFTLPTSRIRGSKAEPTTGPKLCSSDRRRTLSAADYPHRLAAAEAKRSSKAQQANDKRAAIVAGYRCQYAMMGQIVYRKPGSEADNAELNRLAVALLG